MTPTASNATVAYECAVVWTLLVEPSLVADVRSRLRAEDFADPTLRRAWQSVERLAERGELVTEAAIRLDISSSGDLSKIDHEKLVVGSPFPDVDAIDANVQRLIEARRARSGRAAVLEAAGKPTTDESLHELVTRLGAILDEVETHDGFAELADVVPAYLAHLEDHIAGRASLDLMSYGIESLDQRIDGALPGDLVIVAARPGDGKTAFALTVANAVSARNHPVAFFSLEMTKEQLVARLLSAAAEVNGRRFRNPRQLADYQLHAIRAAAADLLDRRILIWDRPASMADVARSCRRLVRQGRAPKLVVIDYLELLTTPKGDRRSDRYDLEIGERTKAAKALAKELGCPVMMLAQVGRDAEKSKRRPTKADLRNSGQIEQDADAILMLYRLPEASDENKKSDVTEILITKGRGMGEGVAKVRFRAEFTRFEEIVEQASPGVAHQDRRLPPDDEETEVPRPPSSRSSSSDTFARALGGRYQASESDGEDFGDARS